MTRSGPTLALRLHSRWRTVRTPMKCFIHWMRRRSPRRGVPICKSERTKSIKKSVKEIGSNIDLGIKGVGNSIDSGIKSIQKVFG